MSNKYFIEIENLTKRYTREVLNIPRLSLERGKIYGIIGPSGAGKSTLLRILNLITPPDSGEIRFDGQPVPENSAARLSLQRRMTLVFQKPVLFKTSVRENVAYGLKARGFKQKEIAGRVGGFAGAGGDAGDGRAPGGYPLRRGSPAGGLGPGRSL